MGVWQARDAGIWPRGEPAPDPAEVRAATLADLAELGYPLPPDGHPLVWEVGDAVSLRPAQHLLARCAVLNTVLAAVFGAPAGMTCGWLERNDLRAATTGPEWQFLSRGLGPADLYGLHIEAVWGLAWILGVAPELDPSRYCADGLATWLPDLGADETFQDWQARASADPRPASEVAALLDLHYCLDAVHTEALMTGAPPPGKTLPYVVGQRRWALEWACVFTGPYHPAPPNWDEVELAP